MGSATVLTAAEACWKASSLSVGSLGGPGPLAARRGGNGGGGEMLLPAGGEGGGRCSEDDELAADSDEGTREVFVEAIFLILSFHQRTSR